MTLTSVRTEIPREPRYQRPLVIPPGGGKPIPYTRTTTYVDCLEDKYLIHLWDKRNVVLGLVERPDLILAAAGVGSLERRPGMTPAEAAQIKARKVKLNQIADDAAEAAKAHAASNIGTAVHALAEQYDRGEVLGTIPGNYRPDLDAYIRETSRLEYVAIEEFMVRDDLKVGGTPDRIARFDGGLYIADIKTGDADDEGNFSSLGEMKIAMQLAMYAHSSQYDPATGNRWQPNVDLNNAIIIHLPAATGRCELRWVDIRTGWEDVQLATQVRAARKRKGLTVPF